jgi:hypothetical protein
MKQWRLCETAEKKSWDNGVHYMVAHLSCDGCCFQHSENCAKPASYPGCTVISSPIGVSSQFRECLTKTDEKPAKAYPSISDCVKIPCKDCTGCVFGSLDTAEGCHHPDRDGKGSECGSYSNPSAVVYILKSDYETLRKVTSTPEALKRKVYPKPEECAKIPCKSCEGCVFGDIHSAEGCNNRDRECGDIHNSGTSMIYKLKSEVNEVTDIELPFPTLIRVDPVIYRDDVDEEIEEDPENLDMEFELDKGGIVMGVRQGDSACGGCYFRDGSRNCRMPRELAENPDCTGVIFELIEDPPSKVEDEEEDILADDGIKLGDIITDKYGNKYEVCVYHGTCRFCAFYRDHESCKLKDHFIEEPNCSDFIFKRIDDEGHEIDPEEDEVLVDEDPIEGEQVPVGETLTIDGKTYISTKDSGGIGAMTSCEACDLDGDLCPGALERCGVNTHFKLVSTGDLVFKKETKFNL